MPKSSFPNLSVLIADPSQHLITIIASMLRNMGVTDIRDAHEAAPLNSLLKLRAFGLMIIDDSADIDGVAITARLRAAQLSANRTIPVIMMSSAPDAARIAAARDAGITEFLRKPFAAQHLETRLLAIRNAPRSFIAAPEYAGPDRRRRIADFDGAEKRGPSHRARNH